MQWNSPLGQWLSGTGWPPSEEPQFAHGLRLFLLEGTRSSDGEFSNGIEMPSFEEELTASNWGTGSCPLWAFLQFSAGYVCILLVALAGICLARLGHVESTGNTIVAQR